MAPYKAGRPPTLRPIVSKLNVRRRVYGLRVHHRLVAEKIMKHLSFLKQVWDVLEDHELSDLLEPEKDIIEREMTRSIENLTTLLFAPDPLRVRLPRLRRTHRTIQSFTDES
jgi:hypothetical protein